MNMERISKRVKGIMIATIVACSSGLLVSSLVFYICVWYSNQKLLVINSGNIGGFIPLIIASFVLSTISICLAIHSMRKDKRIEMLLEENLKLSELIIKGQFKTKEEIISAVKEGVKID